MPKTSHLPSVPLSQPELTLTEALRAAVSRQLPWSNLSPDESAPTVISAAYEQSLDHLQQIQQESLDFFCAASLVTLELPPHTDAAAQRALAAQFRQLITQVSHFTEEFSNVLDPQFTQHPAVEFRRRLQAGLTSSIDTLVERWIHTVEVLAQQAIWGRIEWLPNQDCSYYFYRQRLQLTPAVEVTVTWHPAATLINGELLPPGETLAEALERVVDQHPQTTGTPSVRHKHRYELTRVVRLEVRNKHGRSPAMVTELLRQTPAWLLPLLTIVEGTILSQRVTTTLGHNEVPVDSPPAPTTVNTVAVLTLGPWVITGWPMAAPPAPAPSIPTTPNIPNLSNAPSIPVTPTPSPESPPSLPMSVSDWRHPSNQAVAFLSLGVSMALIALVLLFKVLQGDRWGGTALLATGVALGATWHAAAEFAVGRGSSQSTQVAHYFTLAFASCFGTCAWAVGRWQGVYHPLLPILIPLGLLACAWWSYQAGVEALRS